MDGRGSAASFVGHDVLGRHPLWGNAWIRRRRVLAGLERSSPSRSSTWDVSRRRPREKEEVDDIAPCIVKRVVFALVVPEANTSPTSLWLTWDLQRGRPLPRRRCRPPWPAPPRAAGVSSPASSSSFRRRPGSRLLTGHLSARTRPSGHAHGRTISASLQRAVINVNVV